jgi:hypothetical protein
MIIVGAVESISDSYSLSPCPFLICCSGSLGCGYTFLFLQGVLLMMWLAWSLTFLSDIFGWFPGSSPIIHAKCVKSIFIKVHRIFIVLSFPSLNTSLTFLRKKIKIKMKTKMAKFEP